MSIERVVQSRAEEIVDAVMIELGADRTSRRDILDAIERVVRDQVEHEHSEMEAMLDLAEEEGRCAAVGAESISLSSVRDRDGFPNDDPDAPWRIESIGNIDLAELNGKVRGVVVTTASWARVQAAARLFGTDVLIVSAEVPDAE